MGVPEMAFPFLFLKGDSMKPIKYLQTDSKWKKLPYRTKGETSTIGSAGCGITSSAMIISSLSGQTLIPPYTAEWSMEHGYKALNQGTSYSYFVPQLKEYNIECRRLNVTNMYGDTGRPEIVEALAELQKGNILICCMGKGNWTKSGHYIVAYQYENGYVYINDPASTKSGRELNTWALLASQVKYIWAVTIPEKHNIVLIQNPYPEPEKSINYSKLISNVVQKDVKWMQWELKRIGLYIGLTDGKFGPVTKAALDTFQSQHPETYAPKKSPDSNCGPTTRKYLKQS